MNFFYKITKSILFLFLIFELAAFMLAIPVQAYDVEVPINETGKTDYDTSQGKAIGAYVGDIYKFAIGSVGIIAAVVMMYGGVLWIVAGGNQEKISEAKAWIVAALTGLFLFMTSYIILNLINPNLTKFQAIKPTDVTALPNSGGTTGGTMGPGGTGASMYKWGDCPSYCTCLGNGWVNVNSSNCTQPSPGPSYDCCGFNNP